MRKRARRIGIFILVVAIVLMAIWVWWLGEHSGVVSVPSSAVVRIHLEPETRADASDAIAAIKSRVAAARTRHAAMVHPIGSVEMDTSEWARRLAARGDRRDLDAQVETFEESMQCRNYHSAFESFRNFQNDPRYQGLDELSPRDLEQVDDTLARLQTVMERAETLCEGSDNKAVERAYHDALVNAALLGDSAAQACYIVRGPQLPRPVSRDEVNSSMNQYLENAPVLTQMALERADPSVAWHALYQFVASPPTHPSAYDAIPLPDAFLTWRAARLMSLRATPELRSELEERLEEMARRGFIGADDIDRADAWANARYEQAFAGQAPVDASNLNPCYPSAWR